MRRQKALVRDIPVDEILQLELFFEALVQAKRRHGLVIKEEAQAVVVFRLVVSPFDSLDDLASEIQRVVGSA